MRSSWNLSDAKGGGSDSTLHFRIRSSVRPDRCRASVTCALSRNSFDLANGFIDSGHDEAELAHRHDVVRRAAILAQVQPLLRIEAALHAKTQVEQIARSICFDRSCRVRKGSAVAPSSHL